MDDKVKDLLDRIRGTASVAADAAADTARVAGRKVEKQLSFSIYSAKRIVVIWTMTTYLFYMIMFLAFAVLYQLGILMCV